MKMRVDFPDLTVKRGGAPEQEKSDGEVYDY